MPRSTFTDGVALAVGTLTRVPVRPPSSVDSHVAGVAMVLAPAVGAVLGLVVGAAAQVAVDRAHVGPLLAAALAVAALAYLTRAIHLDGLADTADALGSGRPPAEALAIARRSDIGPFGVVTIVLVVLVQVTALSSVLATGHGPLVLAIALGSGRLLITAACIRGIGAARADGLGSAVAGSVGRVAALAVSIAWVGVVVVAALAAGGGVAVTAGVAAVGAAVLAGGVLLRTGLRRFGGVTGDLLGAVTEVATTAALVAVVLVRGIAS